mgnify:CR=1 FL=1
MTTDILVIGTGISGLTYAIKIALLSPKKRIILICKSSLDEGNTKYAQGGIAVVSNFKKDSYEKHINDTLIAGAGMCNKKVVDFVVKEGGKRLKELIDWGTEFDKKKQNKFDLGREGGHSAQRIVHHKDHSGSEIIRALIEKIKGLKNIKYLENHLLVDLITDHHMISAPKRCYGAYVISITDQKIIKITSKISILSTGGAGQLFEFTTNPKGATGDGLGAAYRAKVQIKNLPYVQFHPTVLYSKVNDDSFLITEAIRGKGAKLKNINGERFMHKYDDRGELASRDIVSRAISSEMKKNGSKYVLLDTTNIKKEIFEKNFPKILETCKSINNNPLKQSIPVVPAAHYFCGGIEVDIYGRTSLNGLYAIGECSYTGLHGSNRLASNSLLESIVFSHRAAKASIDEIDNLKIEKNIYDSIPQWNGKQSISNQELKIIFKLKLQLQKIMSKQVSIFKTYNGLLIAEKKLKKLYEKSLKLYNEKKLTPQLCELRNMVSVSYLLIKQSLEIKSNSGVFFNQDYVK